MNTNVEENETDDMHVLKARVLTSALKEIGGLRKKTVRAMLVSALHAEDIMNSPRGSDILDELAVRYDLQPATFRRQWSAFKTQLTVTVQKTVVELV